MNSDSARIQLLMQQGRLDLAEAELRQCLGQDADDGWALALLSLCVAERGKPVEARRIAESAVAAEPELALAHYALGVTVAGDPFAPELNRGPWWKYESIPGGPRLRRAAEHLREAIRLDAYHPSFFEMLARLESELGRLSDAQVTVERGLRLDPDDAECNALLVRLLEMQGKAAQAELASRRALGSNPDHADAHAARGWALLHQGKSDEAADSFFESLRLYPVSESSRLGLLEASRALHPLLSWVPRFTRWAEVLQRRKARLFLTGSVLAVLGAACFYVGVYHLRWMPSPQPGQGVGSVVFAGAAFGGLLVIVLPLAAMLLGNLVNVAIFFDPRGRAALIPAERVWAVFLPLMVMWFLAAWVVSLTAGWMSGWGQFHFAMAFALAPWACAWSAIRSRRRVAWVLAGVGTAMAGGLFAGWQAGVLPWGYGWPFAAVFWSVLPITYAGRPWEADAAR